MYPGEVPDSCTACNIPQGAIAVYGLGTANQVDAYALGPPTGAAAAASGPAMGFGAGLTGGVSIEGGLPGLIGAGFNGSVGAGVFYNKQNQQVSGGAYRAGGAVAYAGSHVAQVPSSPGQVAILGGFAGAGGGAFLTNAGNASALGGAFDTYTGNLGVGPAQLTIQISWSGPVYIGSITVGPGYGANLSQYPTNTPWTW